MSHIACALILLNSASTAPAVCESDRWQESTDSANTAFRQGNYFEAEKLFKQSIQLAETAPLNSNRMADSLCNLAMAECEIDKGAEAEKLYERAAKLYEKTNGTNSHSVSTVLTNLALLKKESGNFSEAEKMYDRALAIAQKNIRNDDPDYGRLLFNIASLKQDQAKYAEAQELYNQSLKSLQTSLGPEHPDTANVLNSLAENYESLGNYQKAEKLHKQALALREKVFGKEHPDTLNSLGNLACLYKLQGRYKEAEPLFEQSLAGKIKFYGPNSSRVSVELNNIASLDKDLGKLKDAETTCLKAIDISKKLGVTSREDLFYQTETLGDIYQSQDRFNDAAKAYQTAFSLAQQLFGDKHPNTAGVYDRLQQTCFENNDFEQAETYERKALDIGETTLGPNHRETLSFLSTLGSILNAEGRFSEAQPMLERAKQIATSDELTDATRLLILQDLTVCYYDQGKIEQAEIVAKDALRISETNSPQRMLLTVSLCNLAAIYSKQGKHDAAEPLIARAISILENTLGPDHPKLTSALNQYANILKNTHREAEARALEERIDLIQIRHFCSENASTIKFTFWGILGLIVSVASLFVVALYRRRESLRQ